MTKYEFLAQLSRRTAYMSYEDVRRSMEFYSEAIDDRIEDGMTEEEAVAALGPIDEIVAQMAENQPLSLVMRQRVQDSRDSEGDEGPGGKRRRARLIISPMWLGFYITAAVLLPVFKVTVWLLALSLFAVVIALGVTGAAMAVLSLVLPYPAFGARLMLMGAGLVTLALAGLLVPVAGMCSRKLNDIFKDVFRCVKRSILGEGRASA